MTNVTGWDTPSSEKPNSPASGDTSLRISGSSGDGALAPGAGRRRARQEPPDSAATAQQQPPPDQQQQEKKGGLFNRLKGLFKKKN